MKPILDFVGGARVICYTPIDHRHRFTGGTKQIVAGRLVGVMAGLAVCQYADEDVFYLFGCNADWGTITDTWHQSVDEAKAQAEFEYEGVNLTWHTVA